MRVRCVRRAPGWPGATRSRQGRCQVDPWAEPCCCPVHNDVDRHRLTASGREDNITKILYDRTDWPRGHLRCCFAMVDHAAADVTCLNPQVSTHLVQTSLASKDVLPITVLSPPPSSCTVLQRRQRSATREPAAMSFAAISPSYFHRRPPSMWGGEGRQGRAVERGRYKDDSRSW